CDFVQRKKHENRYVRGILVDFAFHAKKKCFNQSEAVYISPCFEFEGKEMCLILDFRHLFTLKKIQPGNYLSPLFRAKQQLLAEIQSMLARHVSRQGILFLEK